VSLKRRPTPVGALLVPHSRRVSVTSGAAWANADRLIKALAQALIANMDKARCMISSHKSQQPNVHRAADVARLWEFGQSAMPSLAGGFPDSGARAKPFEKTACVRSTACHDA